jgi:hypothetical protein
MMLFAAFIGALLAQVVWNAILLYYARWVGHRQFSRQAPMSGIDIDRMASQHQALLELELAALDVAQATEGELSGAVDALGETAAQFAKLSLPHTRADIEDALKMVKQRVLHHPTAP